MNTSAAPSRFIVRVSLIAALFGATVGAFAGPVVDWNIAMTGYSESQPPPGIPPYIESRVYAMAHIAMLNAITGDDAAAATPFDSAAAVSQAAHDVLVNQFPGGAASFDALLASELAAIPDGPAKDNGVNLGAAAAARKLSLRVNDGSATAEGPYTPGTKPGDYQFTPPFDGPPFNGYAAVPKWGQVKPFVLASGDQFRAPAPYHVWELEYVFDFNEIKALGSVNSTGRTADQTDLAMFWYESSPNGWNRIARVLVPQQINTLLEHARLFAALNASLADSYIASIESKYTYNFWRPITAIQQAGTDDNHLTIADVAWQPLLLTPPVPDYPSAHAAAGGAASTVLIWFFGGNDHTFTFSSTIPTAPRTFYTIASAAKENAISRMLVGIHFRLACTAGYQQGVEVGGWVVQQVEDNAVGWEK